MDLSNTRKRRDEIVYKIINITSKEHFIDYIEQCGQKIFEVPCQSKCKKVWNIKDRFGNEWNLIFEGRADEWKICNVCNYPCDIPFCVEFLSCGKEVEIMRAQKAGRNYKSDRFLKQFSHLMLMANSYIQFGYIKEK